MGHIQNTHVSIGSAHPKALTASGEKVLLVGGDSTPKTGWILEEFISLYFTSRKGVGAVDM